MYELPMFPLEQTFLPSALIPLHIFEPRYREFARIVTPRPDPEFGIAMIERGREVGGDDQRSAVGVVARIVQFEEFPDGRWAIVAAATRRIRIAEWLPDEPFPRALVEDWPDDDAENYLDTIAPGTVAVLSALLSRMDAAMTRIDARRVLGPFELVDDPAQATWQASVIAQLGPLDSMGLLREPTAEGRATLATGLLEERAAVLEALADQAG